MTRCVATCVLFFATVFSQVSVTASCDLWTADPLKNIFRDDVPPEKSDGASISRDEVARGQTATFQIVLRSSIALTKLHCDLTPFASDYADSVALKADSKIRFVGYVSVPAKDMGHPAPDRPHPVPGDFPDPLLVDTQIDLPANSTQAIWISTRVPVDASPGLYRSKATIIADTSDGALKQSIPLELTIHPAKVESVRMKNSNFFHLFHGYGWTPMPAAYSDGYWKLLRTFAKNMAEHRQTVCRTVPLRLSQYSWDPAGNLKVDFSRMDQWIRIFQQEGIHLFEGQQFGWRRDVWKSPYVVSVYVPIDDPKAHDPKFTHGAATPEPAEKVAEIHVSPDSPEADHFYSQFLPQFQSHLESLGLLDTFVQHLGDEPTDENFTSHQQIGALVHKYAPSLRRIDARLTDKGTDAVDVLVPLLDDLHKHFAEYQKLQSAGQELWFYTCVNPQYNYVNRFVTLPLIKDRLLFWVAFRYNVSGYLHWGYDYWSPNVDPFTHPRLPVGDANIVYPGPNFTVLDSIRWEAYRDGLEDHELLSQLAAKDPAAAQRLVARHVIDFNKYDTDLAHFRATRHELLEALDH